MPHEITIEQLRSLRLWSNFYSDAIAGGIQAQDPAAAALSARARGFTGTASDFEAVLTVKRSIVRSWTLRGTIHIHHVDDLRWLIPLLGPTFIRKSERRYRQLGLTGAYLSASLEVLREALSGGKAMIRAELASALDEAGIPVAGQAIAYLVRHAALEGLICFGPDREKDWTYVLIDEWLDLHPPEPDLHPPEPELNPLAELARCYLNAYGPAAPEDLASWSGVGMNDTRQAFEYIADELIEVHFANQSLWLPAARQKWLGTTQSDPSTRLLPAFDTYLLGYADRDFMVSPENYKQINAGGGMIKPTIMVDGRLVGTWKVTKKKQRGEISLEAFETLDKEMMTGIEWEVADIGRFLGLEVTLI